MAFKNDPGFGSLFRNNYKEKENQPDHKGSACCPLCEKQLDISAWIKEGRNGKFFSLALQEEYKKKESKPDPDFEPDEDIPF